MKRLFSIGVLLQAVTTVMTVSLVAACAVYAAGAWQSREDARRVPTIIDISNDLLSAVQTLRLERGNVVASLVTPGVVVTDAQDEIGELRLRSADALDAALLRLGTIGAGGYTPLIADMRANYDSFVALRDEADAALQSPQDQRPKDLSTRWIATHMKVADAIDRLSVRLENELIQSDPFVSDMVRLKQLTWAIRADTGRDRFRVAMNIGKGKTLTEKEKLDYAALNGRIDGAWKIVEERTASEGTPPELAEAVRAANESFFTDFREKHNAILADLAAGRTIAITAPQWMTFGRPGEEAIVNVGNVALQIASAHAFRQFVAAQEHFVVAIGFMVLFTTIGLLTSLYVFRGVMRPITGITETMRSLASGNLDCEIPYDHRADEIGDLSQGLRVFRDHGIEKQRLRAEKDGAEAASRAKSEFLANVSHELRTPLNAVIGFSEAMTSEIFGTLSDRYRGYAADIFTSGTHLLGLINEILDLSKLEAGRLELHEENVELSAAVEACMNLVETQAHNSRVRLSVAIDRDYPMLRADEMRLRQIMINLLSNAVKFTPEGGRVLLRTFASGGRLTIQVMDTGIGMAPKDIPKALMPFGQVDSKISRKHAGTGLGLPLAKHLVELHGGSLTIESAVNAGTTVTIAFPPERTVVTGREVIAGAA